MIVALKTSSLQKYIFNILVLIEFDDFFLVVGIESTGQGVLAIHGNAKSHA